MAGVWAKSNNVTWAFDEEEDRIFQSYYEIYSVDIFCSCAPNQMNANFEKVSLESSITVIFNNLKSD